MSEKNNDQQGSPFAQLLDDLEVMKKSMDDEQAAAAAKDDDQDDKDKKDGEVVDNDGDGDGKPPTMAKSLQVTLQDGTVIEAEDGTELVKSLMDRVEDTESVMAKALGHAVELIKSQGAQIKELAAKVEAVSAQPAKRKSVLTVHERPAGTTMAKSQPEGMPIGEFMAKSNAAYAAGKLTGHELTVIDVSLRQGQFPSAELIAKVTA